MLLVLNVLFLGCDNVKKETSRVNYSQVNSTLILFVCNSKIIVLRFLLLFKLKRIWVECGDPSGAGHFSLEVNK